jgi:hypothetical protein
LQRKCKRGGSVSYGTCGFWAGKALEPFLERRLDCVIYLSTDLINQVRRCRAWQCWAIRMSGGKALRKATEGVRDYNSVLEQSAGQKSQASHFGHTAWLQRKQNFMPNFMGLLPRRRGANSNCNNIKTLLFDIEQEKDCIQSGLLKSTSRHSEGATCN